METNGAPTAQQGSFAPTPSGFRRLTPGLLHADRTAGSFAGLPDGVTTPGQLLAGEVAELWAYLQARLTQGDTYAASRPHAA